MINKRNGMLVKKVHTLMACCMKSIAISSPNSSPATRVNLLMMEQAPHIAITNSIKAVQTQTLNTFKQCCVKHMITLLSKTQQRGLLPSRPSQEEVTSKFRSSLCEVKHECIHNNSRLCNTEYKQWLTSDNRVNDAANGGGC